MEKRYSAGEIALCVPDCIEAIGAELLRDVLYSGEPCIYLMMIISSDTLATLWALACVDSGTR
jgi:hypothetical protein